MERNYEYIQNFFFSYSDPFINTMGCGGGDDGDDRHNRNNNNKNMQ